MPIVIMNKIYFHRFYSKILKPSRDKMFFFLSFFAPTTFLPHHMLFPLPYSCYNWLMTFSSCESTMKQGKRECVCAGAQPYALLLAVLLPVKNPTVMYSCSISWAYDPATIPMLLSRPPAITTGR